MVGHGVTFGLTPSSPSNGYIFVPASTNLHLQNQWTIDVWVYPKGNGPGNQGFVIIEKGFQPPYGNGHDFLLLAWTGTFSVPVPNRFVFLFGPMSYFYSNFPHPAGQWYHVAVTYDGTTVTLYVNGNPEGTMAAPNSWFSTPANYDPTTPWSIGSSPPPYYTHTWNGTLDDLEIWNRQLSQTEIQKIVNAQGAGKCPTGITYTPEFPTGSPVIVVMGLLLALVVIRSHKTRKTSRRDRRVVGVGGHATGRDMV
jgi:hypothetical protein